jgi:hypothetical protein
MKQHKSYRPLWQLLILISNQEKYIPLTCDECFILLEYDADQLAAGGDMDRLRSAAMNHLGLCSKKCHAEINNRLDRLEVIRP